MTDPGNPEWEEEASEPEISVSAVMRAHGDDVLAGDAALSGERFGKYLLVGELAVGGMAEVLLAVHKGLEGFIKVVVIKRVLPHHAANIDYVRMFVDEARLAARLEHPNIVRTYEFGEVNSTYFTVMEYLPGEDLGRVLNRLIVSTQRMPVHMAAGIVSQLCVGLHFAHQFTDTTGYHLNLVHRDINPQNVVITYGGEVKVIDFGVAKTNTNNVQTLAGTIKGKIAYMSPEQILCQPIDQRSDLFSTGIVLWETLTGKPLFNRDSEAATLYAIMNDPIPAPSALRPDVPAALDAIVAKALARDPKDRYASAEEMGAALDEFLTTQPKYDPRQLGALVEALFGSTRAEAKRSIAQTRSLAANISLVMKARAGRGDIAEGSSPSTSTTTHGATDGGGDEADTVNFNTGTMDAEPAPSSRRVMFGLAAVIIVAIGAGLFYGLRSSSAPAQNAAAQALGNVEVVSVPPGGAVFVGGEPTGLKTPTTLTGIPAGAVSIRVELRNHGSVTHAVEVVAGATITRSFELDEPPAPAPPPPQQLPSGQVSFSGLPTGAAVFIDGIPHTATEVITVEAGAHKVRIELRGKLLVDQSVEVTGGGAQVWKLAGGKLIPKP
jgi:eukaryotic-like serine/threonine-protein kinase